MMTRTATRNATRTAIPIPIREPDSPWREPTLDEMLSDPVVTAVMRADRVDPAKLQAMLNRIAGELHTRQRLAPFDGGAALTRSFVFIPCRTPGDAANGPKTG